MDVNDFRIIVTVLSLVAFVAIAIWAWRRPNQAAFDEAAMLPFADDEWPSRPSGTVGGDTK